MTSSVWENIMASTEPIHPDLEPYLEVTDFGTMLKHPLVYALGVHPAMVNYQYAGKLEALARARAEEDWHQVIWLHERPYRLTALLSLPEQMDDEDFWVCVRNVWIDSENIWQHQDDWIDVFASSRPGREALMLDEEHTELAAMDEPITIYRGFTLGVNEDGLSWTTDLERAQWFARRFASEAEDRDVVEAVIAHSEVAAYFTGRGENEIVARDLDGPQFVRYLSEETP